MNRHFRDRDAVRQKYFKKKIERNPFTESSKEGEEGGDDPVEKTIIKRSLNDTRTFCVSSLKLEAPCAFSLEARFFHPEVSDTEPRTPNSSFVETPPMKRKKFMNFSKVALNQIGEENYSESVDGSSDYDVRRKTPVRISLDFSSPGPSSSGVVDSTPTTSKSDCEDIIMSLIEATARTTLDDGGQEYLASNDEYERQYKLKFQNSRKRPREEDVSDEDC